MTAVSSLGRSITTWCAAAWRRTSTPRKWPTVAVPAVYREPADQMGPLRPRQSKVPRASSVAAHSRVAQLVAMARCSGRPVVLQDSTAARTRRRSEEHTSELQSRGHLVCRLLLEKKKHDMSELGQHSDTIAR